MASYSNFFFTLLLSCSVISLVDASKDGITVDLIHRDSPLSPFYNPNQTRFERLRNAFHRSFARKASLNPTSTSTTDTLQALLMKSKVGEYLMKISIGTPPVEILAIADTGSDLLWTQCLPRTNFYKQNAPVFDPRRSTSYRHLVCESNLCLALGNEKTCDNGNNCKYSVSYRDDSYSKGDLAMETISLQSNSGGLKSYMVAFGCGHDNNDTSEGTGAGIKTGIIGLGGGDLSLVNQLYKYTGGKFSYCLAPSDSPSKISFGSNALVSGPKVVSTPLTKKDNFYYLTLEGITVGTNRINYGTINSSSTDQGNIVIDSGTMLTSFEKGFYQTLESALVQVIKGESVTDPKGDYPLCYQNNNSGRDFEAPKIVLHFTDADLELSSTNTFHEIGSGMLCFNMLPSEPNDNFAILGNLNQMNYRVGYDLVNNKVSFMPTDCSKFP